MIKKTFIDKLVWFRYNGEEKLLVEARYE